VAGWLVIRSGPRVNQQLKLRAGSNIVGRDGRKAQLVVEEPSVSGEHAKIRYENGVFVIYDLASTNGTYVNGHRVEKQRLMDNDLVRLGRMEFVFKVVDPRHRSS
jgi:pSer/pThr/pTyr-binding forkhead associated (FHA) protein